MRVILAGFGVVGRSLAEILLRHGAELRRRNGLSPRVVAVADSGGAAVNEKGLDLAELLKVKQTEGTVAAHKEFGRLGVSVMDLLDEVGADVLVDATPTNLVNGEPSYSNVRRALSLGIHVVTVNKGPLALALPALKEIAEHRGAILRFSGTVGGGMPVIEFARECARGDRIVKVEGVLNGTTNYILTRMEEGLGFEEALREAQEKGYAERDPSLDIKGFDTAAKLVILANEVLGIKATLQDVSVKGIEGIESEDLREARRVGKTIRLLGIVDGGLRVEPAMVDLSDPLNVKYSMNSVAFTAHNSGRHIITGRGAGGKETATAILRDMIEVKQRIAGETP